MVKVFVECGTTFSTGVMTGIQRVVKNIISESADIAEELEFEMVRVCFSGDSFYEFPTEKVIVNKPLKTILLGKLINLIARINNSWLFSSSQFDFLRAKGRPFFLRLIALYENRIHPKGLLDKSLESNSLSILLLLDSTWNGGMWRSLDSFRSSGGHVCAVLYDLIPFSHPETVEEGTRIAHTRWWLEAPSHIDSIICISNAVKEDFLIWQRRMKIPTQMKAEDISYFHLGAEIKTSDPMIHVVNSSTPYFLVVGSFEPRKNHKYILDAFDELWKKNEIVNLVLVGSNGWKSEDLFFRINNHPEINKRLFLIQDASDRDLNTLYRCSAGVIIASLAEGFGLPIVEALNVGVPVLCSDISVFREVASDRADYFSLDNPMSLVNLVASKIDALSNKNSNRSSSGVKWITWKESARQLFANVLVLALAKKAVK